MSEITSKLAPVTPSITGLQANLKRGQTPDRVYYFDLGVADNVKDEIYQYIQPTNTSATVHPGRKEIAVYDFLGYDVFRVRLEDAGKFTAPVVQGAVVHKYPGAIHSWQDFDAYPWPDVKDINFGLLEWYEEHLPSNMGVTHTLSVWEVVRKLFGFEQFCFYLYDMPDLVEAVFAKVGDYYTQFARALADFSCVFSLFGGDDLGYKTSTLLPPEVIRSLILPWHQKWAEIAHQANKLYFLHSCGKIDALMEDIISVVKVDAKHSFEDVIEPVTVAKQKYGYRLSLLGGLDVDFLARADEASIRAKVRQILEICMPNGGYCLGSGNWITSYIPLNNYLAVLDEGRKWKDS